MSNERCTALGKRNETGLLLPLEIISVISRSVVLKAGVPREKFLNFSLETPSGADDEGAE